ncbi:MAG: FecR domain-containing protein [Acidovorax sp.]|uniref:FecR family protein n=1 Tax=Acidovorax sp. TaxID=1872122 RepID=UPI0039E694B9
MTSAHAARQAASPAPANPQDGSGTPPEHPFDAALDAERDALRALFPLPPPKPPRARTALRNGGAAALVLGTATGLLYWADPAWRTEHHATAIGEQRSVALADGSTLTLDTATALDVSWHLRSRRVALRHGQARFAVEPSAWRPFEVTAAATRIRVVGTIFDVRRDRDQVQVTVLQGRVEVRGPGSADAPQLLTPGQRLHLGGPLPATPQPVDATQVGAWQLGRLVFDRTPLREALAEVQRYRSAPIRLRDDGRLGAQAVTGVFETAHTDQLLDLLPRIVPAQVRRHGDGSVEISPDGR